MVENFDFKTINGLYQIGKGEEYYRGCGKYFIEKEFEPYWKFFNEKLYRVSEEVVSYRVLNHWEENGVIQRLRPEGGGYRQFSIMDIIWLTIVLQLRQFGVSIKDINSVQNCIRLPYNQLEYSELEYFTFLAYITRTPVFILIFSDFKAEVATAYEIQESEEKYGMLNYISINLNQILQNLFPKNQFKPVYKGFIDISETEAEILKTIQKEKVEEIILNVKEKKPISMSYTVSEPLDSNIGMLKNKNSYQEIKIAQHNSKTTSIRRTISKKF